MDDTLSLEKQGLLLSSSNSASISLNIPSDGMASRIGDSG